MPSTIEAVVLFLAFFVGVPAIAALIGYAAWMGKPKNWDRSMFWTAFVASTIASGFLMVFAQRMEADVRTLLYLAQMALFGLGVLLIGVAGGCFLGVFMYQRGKAPVWRGATSRHEHSADNVKSKH